MGPFVVWAWKSGAVSLMRRDICGSLELRLLTEAIVGAGAAKILRKICYFSWEVLGSTMPSCRVYQFGPFRLDADGRVLFRGGERVVLTPKAVDVLIALVE